MKEMDLTPPADTAQDEEVRMLMLESRMAGFIRTILPPKFELQGVSDVRFGREGDFFRDTENTGPAQDREGFYVEIDFMEARPLQTDPRIPENECRGIINAYSAALKGQMPDGAIVSVSARAGSVNLALVIPYSMSGQRIQSYWDMKVRCFIPSDCFDEFVDQPA